MYIEILKMVPTSYMRSAVKILVLLERINQFSKLYNTLSIKDIVEVANSDAMNGMKFSKYHSYTIKVMMFVLNL